MPALTIVAECRYAEAGVGAAIASGSQKWNGTCALLVNAPTRMSSSATGNSGSAWTRSRAAASAEISNVPAIAPRIRTPASSASPPAPVTVSAIRAPCRASARSLQYPTSRNELTLVSSQNTTSSNRLSARTMPSIAAMKSISRPKNFPAGSRSLR